MEQKIQKSFVDHGFGFPVILMNVPMIRIRGKWTPNINYNKLTDAVLRALCAKPARLTGNEVKFIRQHFEMTLQAFSARFSVSHVAVIKWEKKGDNPTAMNWATEKDIRLFVLSRLTEKDKALAELYRTLEQEKEARQKDIELDAHTVAA